MGVILLDEKKLQAVLNEKIAEINPYKNPIYYSRDDMRTAKLFSQIIHEQLRYNVTAKEWYYYDGCCWRCDMGGMQAERFAKMFAAAIQLYAENLIKKATAPSDEEKKSLHFFASYARSFGNIGPRTTMLKDSKSNLIVKQEEFDQQDYLFNCKNCVIDLRTGASMKHDSDLMLSKVAEVDYDPSAKSIDFEKFVSQIMCGDEDKANYLQTILGYGMSGSNEREEAYMLYGSTTRNGKSTLMDTINHLFGDYSVNIKPDSLAEHQRRGSSASGDIARLKGCRLVQMSEPPRQMKLDVALFKTLTGRDVITARFLYQNDFDFNPVFKLFINTNHLPIILDNTLFTSGRIKVITFDRHFNEEEQDNNLKARLKEPKNLSGILNWLLEGNRRYREDPSTMVPPDSVKKATEQYMENSDKISCYFNSRLIEYPDGVIPLKELYPDYSQWCTDENYSIDGKQLLSERLKERGLLKQSATIDGKTKRNVVIGYKMK